MGAVFSSALITGRFDGVWLSGLAEIVGGCCLGWFFLKSGWDAFFLLSVGTCFQMRH